MLSQHKYLPGPWVILGISTLTGSITITDKVLTPDGWAFGRNVCIVQESDTAFQTRATAALISAAPDMHALLERIHEVLVNYSPDGFNRASMSFEIQQLLLPLNVAE